jgi:hypothetical protein
MMRTSARDSGSVLGCIQSAVNQEDPTTYFSLGGMISVLDQHGHRV